MKKQIIYPEVMSRLFAVSLDLLLCLFIITPIQAILSLFMDFSTMSFTTSLVNFTIQMVILTIASLGCWCYKQASIGKIIMRMKIVDAQTLGRPTNKQFIIRYLLYPTALLGIFVAIFSKKKQTIHDRISGTLVIKV